MKTLIVVHSYHHNNTLKIAKVIAEEIRADIKTVPQAKGDNLSDYDLVGFGAGIDSGMHYKELLDFAKEIELNIKNKKCFIFSTSGVYSEKKVIEDHAKLNEILLSKGYSVLGNFSCLGFNTNSILKYLGGINKGHPNDMDINNARSFALLLLNSLSRA